MARSGTDKPCLRLRSPRDGRGDDARRWCSRQYPSLAGLGGLRNRGWDLDVLLWLALDSRGRGRSVGKERTQVSGDASLTPERRGGGGAVLAGDRYRGRRMLSIRSLSNLCPEGLFARSEEMEPTSLPKLWH